MTDQTDGREIALDMLIEILEDKKFSHNILANTLRKHQQLQKQERAFISRLCVGTLKQYMTLDYVINQFASLPVAKMKPLIRNLLRLSVYQIMYMDQVPVSAVCNEAVKLAKKRGFTKLSGFINGILRNIARNISILSFPDERKEPAFYLEVRYSTPRWLIDRLLEQYEFSTVEAMLNASLRDKELTIRCNQNKISPDELKECLQKEGVTVEASEYLNYAFKLKDYDYLEGLESFRKGYYTVQDVSSMLVCQVAGIRKQDFVVDLCAAPGGKALHAAETAAKVSARDLSERKIRLIQDNIKRMGFTNIETKVWDATKEDEALDSLADVVIADLPCSGLGIMGKKPDIKYNLTMEQLRDLTKLQRSILKQAVKYVKVGGYLMFSTCTVNRNENLDNRNWLLENFDFEAVSLEDNLPPMLHCETTKEGYLQLIQGIHNTDGFFLCKMRRRSE